ncbi:MAG: orotidine-5'-phosphate decarboxylase [Vampirovibrionales bacterium]|nr:orotidine-5'-phosphate decarboxylase [Vampirovibrionales bacterium]
MTQLILALDSPTPAEAWQRVMPLLAETELSWVKIGMSLFYQPGGRDLLEKLDAARVNIFLDLKLHDIPATVSRTLEGLYQLPWRMLTLHTLGGEAMLEAAQAVMEKLENSTAQATLDNKRSLLGVTVLTSHSEATLRDELGLCDTPEQAVIRLATLAANAGLGGIICSPQEIQSIRQHLSPPFKLITPGIRIGSVAPDDDQVRVATPEYAARAGADFIVVGRPILLSPNPCETTREIIEALKLKRLSSQSP